MRLLHTADLHIGLNRYNPPTNPFMRLDDQLGSLRRFFEAATVHDVDVAIIAGDLFHQRNPPPEAEAGVIEIVRDYGRDTIILPGNHDGMTVVGNQRTHTLSVLKAADFDNVRVITEPTVVMLGPVDDPKGFFVCFPYPHKRAFDQVRSDLSPEERMIEIGKFLQEQIEGIPKASPSWGDLPRIFVGHLSVAGSVVASERTMRFGWDIMVGAEAFEGYDYAALGHIHVAQNIGPKAYYPGSPEYIDFGEVGHAKGFLLVDVEHGKNPVVTRIDSQPRQMIVLDHPDMLEFDAPDGAIVRALLGTEQRLKVNGNPAYMEVRYDAPEPRPEPTLVYKDGKVVTEMRTRSLDGDTDWETALKHWLALNDEPEEPVLSAARGLISAPE